MITARLDITLAKSTNYIPMGNWDDKFQYKLSDVGIPVVKVPNTSVSAGFTAWALNSNVSTVGLSPDASGNSEWRLVESAEFIYMLSAYIEHLQAALVTAERIESLMIRTNNLEVLNGAKIGSFSIENGNLTVTHSWMTYIGSSYVQVNQKTSFASNGVLIEASYGGTADHPSVISWGAKLSASGVEIGNIKLNRHGVTAGEMEYNSYGVYRNGVKVL